MRALNGQQQAPFRRAQPNRRPRPIERYFDSPRSTSTDFIAA
jgi:hypothetical protein